ncbi:unnamed protein product [Amoebophrya sp. A120]|nr:unnamed protein product [Amoebophrya sp. A120]|eukprot:GSA120T00007019001.1
MAPKLKDVQEELLQEKQKHASTAQQLAEKSETLQKLTKEFDDLKLEQQKLILQAADSSSLERTKFEDERKEFEKQISAQKQTEEGLREEITKLHTTLEAESKEISSLEARLQESFESLRRSGSKLIETQEVLQVFRTKVAGEIEEQLATLRQQALESGANEHDCLDVTQELFDVDHSTDSAGGAISNLSSTLVISGSGNDKNDVKNGDQYQKPRRDDVAPTYPSSPRTKNSRRIKTGDHVGPATSSSATGVSSHDQEDEAGASAEDALNESATLIEKVQPGQHQSHLQLADPSVISEIVENSLQNIYSKYDLEQQKTTAPTAAISSSAEYNYEHDDKALIYNYDVKSNLFSSSYGSGSRSPTCGGPSTEDILKQLKAVKSFTNRIAKTLDHRFNREVKEHLRTKEFLKQQLKKVLEFENQAKKPIELLHKGALTARPRNKHEMDEMEFQLQMRKLNSQHTPSSISNLKENPFRETARRIYEEERREVQRQKILANSPTLLVDGKNGNKVVEKPAGFGLSLNLGTTGTAAKPLTGNVPANSSSSSRNRNPLSLTGQLSLFDTTPKNASLALSGAGAVVPQF